MGKRKAQNVHEMARSEEQKLPDSGYGSDDIQPPASKRLAPVTTIEKELSRDVEPPAAPKLTVKVTSDQNLLMTPKRVNTAWLQDDASLSSEPPATPWIGATSSPDFDNQKHKSPSLNYGQHRVTTKPNRHFDRHFTAPAEVFKGVKKLRMAYAEQIEYIDQLLMEHVSELRYKVTAMEEENAALKERNAVLEAGTVDYYDTIDEVEEDELV